MKASLKALSVFAFAGVLTLLSACAVTTKSDTADYDVALTSQYRTDFLNVLRGNEYQISREHPIIPNHIIIIIFFLVVVIGITERWMSQKKKLVAPVNPTTDTNLIAGRYQVRGDNGDIIYDTTTGLEWQRCSLGQTWDGHACIGNAKGYMSEEIRAATDQVPGWRLPTVYELKTLIYCSNGKPERFGCKCSGHYQRPTIVTEAFPNMPSSFFWAHWSYAGISIPLWRIHFSSGRAYLWHISLYGQIRLVRGGQ